MEEIKKGPVNHKSIQEIRVLLNECSSKLNIWNKISFKIIQSDLKIEQSN